MSTEEKAERDFQSKARIFRAADEAVGGDGWTAEDQTNLALGQNILREEIGFFGPWEGARYGFDQETKDRLLAHGRQDSASALAMARSAFREASEARKIAKSARLLSRWILVLVLILILQGFVIFSKLL